MPTQRLVSYLDSQNVKYITITHSLAFTALEIAKSAHVSSKEMAKTVIIHIDGQAAMVVLPAAYKMNLELLKQAFPKNVITLASEQEFSSLFPDCEVGAMPPFGNLYDMAVFVAESVTEHDMITFNAGSHSEVIRMRYRDFERLVSPTLVLLSS